MSKFEYTHPDSQAPGQSTFTPRTKSKKRRARGSYSAEFKNKVVLEHIEGNRTGAVIGKDYGMPAATVYQWVGQYRQNGPFRDGHTVVKVLPKALRSGPIDVKAISTTTPFVRTVLLSAISNARKELDDLEAALSGKGGQK